MPLMLLSRRYLFAVLLVLSGLPAVAQGSKADYDRSAELSKRFQSKVTKTGLQPFWNETGASFWYRMEEGDHGFRWYAVDAKTGEYQLAFDHERLAELLYETARKEADPSGLRLKGLRIPNKQTIEFEFAAKAWTYHLDTETLAMRAWDTPEQHGWRPPPNVHWKASIREHNIVLDPVDADGQRIDGKPARRLTNDGTPDDRYRLDFRWSPDGKKLAVMKRRSGDDRRVTIIDSSPDDQLQPKTDRYFYLKPGDKVSIDRPVLFDITTMQRVELPTDPAPNPYRIDGVRWRADSSAFTYEYNQRGHQVYRVIEVDAETGESRVLIEESPETFFTYSSKKFLYCLDAADELIWMSERDGWNHLYLYDWQTGDVKRQITKGEWVVRKVDRVDEDKRVVWFWACGIHPGQDPYHEHYCRVDLDTGVVTPLTRSDGTHTAVSVSPGGKTLVATWSRVDHPPVHELRDAGTGELIKEIARADASSLIDAGWIAPERFVAKGRDGQTDIHGILIKPTNFDPAKRYPVIEQVYAGPHGQHVPKRFYGMHRNMQLAELGFIVVQIDGMGTNWRSKAFHDVAWKDLKDAGFPDRIAWMEAAAETRPWMDLSRVGIYGGSAGGQNAMRAVLDHHHFYKAAAADCGCHDNRMDKIWWNEQWMGWPVDQSYTDSSNVEDAHKLGGALLLTVGELDRNVDPASTMQVVDALIKADKKFELMVFPGKGHGAGESAYGQRLRADFFVRELYGVGPRRE